MIFTAALGACGAPQRADETPEGADAGATEEAVGPPSEAPSLDPRALLRSATFGRLVASVRQLEEDDGGDSPAGCLLRAPQGPSGYRLEADLAVAIRPLPDPPEDLDGRVGASGAAVRPLTPWGQVGSARESMLIGSFTSLPPVGDERAVVLVVTDRGVYVRFGDHAAPESAIGPRPVEDVAATVREQPSSVVFVTAEAGVRVADLATLLAALPAAVPVALAVPLAPETTLPPGTGPDATGADGSTEGLCSDGLPPRPAGADLGELSAEALMSRVAPVRRTARRCLESTAPRDGGRVVLAFRVGPAGAVEEACARSDDIGSAPLRQCLLEALRAIPFPAPSPAGSVDVELPLVLQYDHQRALCQEDHR